MHSVFNPWHRDIRRSQPTCRGHLLLHLRCRDARRTRTRARARAVSTGSAGRIPDVAGLRHRLCLHLAAYRRHAHSVVGESPHASPRSPCANPAFVVLFAKVTVLRNTDLQPHRGRLWWSSARGSGGSCPGLSPEWWGLTPNGSVTTGVPAQYRPPSWSLSGGPRRRPLAEQRHRRNLLVLTRRLDHTRAVITAAINERQQATISRSNHSPTRSTPWTPAVRARPWRRCAGQHRNSSAP
jgi:hypothetical protein